MDQNFWFPSLFLAMKINRNSWLSTQNFDNVKTYCLLPDNINIILPLLKLQLSKNQKINIYKTCHFIILTQFTVFHNTIFIHFKQIFPFLAEIVIQSDKKYFSYLLKLFKCWTGNRTGLFMPFRSDPGSRFGFIYFKQIWHF